jgi:hypothetical protein
MEASQNKSDVTIQFLVGGLVISLCRNFPSIWFRSKVIQEFHACAMVNFFKFLGANICPLKFSLQISTAEKALP